MIPIKLLLDAYQTGLFPMAVDGRIEWFSPNRRGVLPLDRLHVSKRLRRVLRQRKFRHTINQAFPDVISACAARPDDVGNWINGELIDSYLALHAAGFAHSVEVWSGQRLIGGLYGVGLNGAFFGESMFHIVTDASKIALCKLVERLQQRSYRLLDVQWLTPHLARFGAIEIDRRNYLVALERAMKMRCQFGD
jgi:leucyl/phenylalanyl-tRNA--protein transferase